MQRQAVISTAIAAVGYNATERVLEVEYSDGDVYYYRDVPPHVHEEFLGAESLGIFVNTKIKPSYRCDKATSLSETC